MQKRKLRVVFGATALLIGAVFGVLQAADRSATEQKRVPERGISDSGAPVDSALPDDSEDAEVNPYARLVPDIELHELPADTVFDTWVVYPDGTIEVDAVQAVAGAGERLVYSNTLGTLAAPLPINSLISDDISTTSPNGCAMKRFTFQVTGKVLPTGQGGPYTVNYALYEFCPGALSTAQRPNIIVPGTNGSVTFPDDLPHTVSVVLPPNTLVPNNFYLGITMNRNNAGVIMGAPPLVGHSRDIWDFPQTGACNSFLGGFPEQPHATINAEFFADDDCGDTFIGYRADNPKQNPQSPGANNWLVDDLELNTPICRMVSYEVMVKGIGFYQFEVRNNCGGGVLPGTQRSASISTDGSIAKKLHFDFDPPIQIPRNVWFATLVGTPFTGIVVTGADASTGATQDLFGVQTPGQSDCTIVSVAGDGSHAAVNVTITCDGIPPVGACCDMFVLDSAGEAVCRQVPEMNCPFPPKGSQQYPQWEQGAPCSPNPFDQPCGLASCCGIYQRPHPINEGQFIFQEDCENKTRNQCNVQHPIAPNYPGGAPSLWQRGQFCGFQGQICPRVACLERGGDCTTPHATFGCNDAFCCNDICSNFGELGAYCCEVEWDPTCVDLVQVALACDKIKPSNDDCASSRQGFGARVLPIPGALETDVTNATDSIGDPDFCCHNGEPPVCVDGPLAGQTCSTDANCCEFDCGPGGCFGMCQGGPTPGADCTLPANPGACGQGGTCVGPGACEGGPKHGETCANFEDCCGEWCGVCPGRQGGPDDGLHSVWYKFTATHTSVELSTCGSNSPAGDSLIQVFDPDDPTNDFTACDTLQVIACGDDTAGCSSGGTNTRLCVKNLTVNKLYYVLLSGKTLPTVTNATYRLTAVAPCTGTTPVSNDVCTSSMVLGPGNSTTPFNLANTTPDCPFDSCVPTMINDIWYDFTPSSSGSVTIETCGADVNTSPNTSMAIYLGCDSCPGSQNFTDAMACSSFVGGACGFASKVTFNAQAGQCYKIRLGDDNGNPVSGNLKVTASPPCPSGSITADTPPNNVVDARRPHDPLNNLPLLGINQALVIGPGGAPAGCFSVCETTNAGSANSITNVSGNVNYTVVLSRPIFPGALMKIKYGASATTYISHPGNANGDNASNPNDVLALVSRLGGGPALPFGMVSQDIDRSGVFTPLDLLDEIDILNGAEEYIVWLNSAKATPNGNCP